MFPQSTVNDNIILSEDEIKSFIIKNSISKNGIVIPEKMKTGIINYVKKMMKSLCKMDYADHGLLSSWDDTYLIKQAYSLIEYKHLLMELSTCVHSELFTNDYLRFSQNLEILKSIENNNVFALYFHSLMLRRNINKIQKDMKVRLSNPVVRPEKLKEYYKELILVLQLIRIYTDSEYDFWVTAIKSLLLNTLASFSYADSSSQMYDINRSKIILKKAYELCDKGEISIETTKEEVINFYTLNGSLIKTLPYPSFSKQKDAVIRLGLLNEEDLRELRSLGRERSIKKFR